MTQIDRTLATTSVVTPRGRVRVWELATASGLSTQEVRKRLDQLGWPTKTHASTVPQHVAELFATVVTPVTSDRHTSIPREPRPLALLLSYLTACRSGWTRLTLLSLAMSAVTLAVPWPLKLLVDEVLARRTVPAPVSMVSANLTVAIAILAVTTLVVFAVSSLLEVLVTRLSIRVSQSMVYDLGADVLSRLQQRSMLFHGRVPVGDSMSRVMVDSYGLSSLVQAILLTPVQAVTLVVGMVAVLAQLDLLLSLAAGATAVIMTVASALYGRAIRRAARSHRDAEGGLAAHVQQVLSGLPVVQAFAQESRELRRFRGLADVAIATQRRKTVYDSVNRLGSGFIGAVGSAAILWFGAQRVLSGALSVGSLLIFMTYLAAMRTQCEVLARVYPTVQASRASVDRVLELLIGEPEVADKRGARSLSSLRGSVVFEGVQFGYEPDRPVLVDVSLAAEPGQTVALVGPSGAGKTTLVSLLPRFFDPVRGRVLIDGHDVRDVSLSSLRRQISIVLQEPFLFPISIADNVAYGCPTADRARVERAARAANAHEFIVDLPQGYDTVVGERGATLSGGQRQRISIARALLKDAPLLVLDEPTSALDTESESLLLEALERLMAGRTTLIIAHRLSTIRHADQILVMDKGRIVQTGTHDRLVAADGLYQRLHGGPQRHPATLSVAQ